MLCLTLTKSEIWLIKQRKIDVIREKLRNLLTPDHFIEYGRSNGIQYLLRAYNAVREWSNSAIRKMFTPSYATQYRDYLFTSLCIGNGLRACTIMHLTIRDFEWW